ncbi:MAG: hypothetical protein ACRDL0_14520 [Thermoleophilaceae bacterium]
MTPLQRIALLVGALVVTAAAFLILRPGDDEETAPGRSSTTAGEPTETTEQTTTDTAQAEQEPPARPKPQFTRIRVRGGAPVGGEAEVSVEKGETIRLAVRSDVADEVHVHGYDLSRPVGPGAPVRLSFTADIEGIFEVELEERAVPIAQLEVTP